MIGHRVPIVGDTSSPQTYRQLRTWLETCDAEHAKCQLILPQEPSLPTRLIYLAPSKDILSSQPRDIILQPRLVSTNDIELEFSESSYIALSYRWPERFPNEAKLTQDSLPKQMRGLQTCALPQIFNDVFEVAVRIGISYVWIDSLCIIQDDHEDWNHEASLMGNIYRNAYFTIAIATPITQSQLGLFRGRDSSQILSERFLFPFDDGLISDQEIVVMDTPKEQKAFSESPLLCRGWCFQERELSRRIVHYTGTQVLWECRTCRASECLPKGVAPYEQWPEGDKSGTGHLQGWSPRMLDIKFTSESVWYIWRRAVEDYSLRQLTRYTDKLPALAGLARTIYDYESAQCRYLAGLWEHDFISALAWASKSLDWCWDVPGTNRRYPKYVAPTWSWASVEGPVTYKLVAHRHVMSNLYPYRERSKLPVVKDFREQIDPAKYALRIIDIQTQPCNADSFGAVRHGVLRCIAWLIPAELEHDGSRRVLMPLIGNNSIGDMIFDVPQEENDGHGVRTVFCIYLGVKPRNWTIYHSAGLAVLPTGNEANEYRRVGFIESMRLSEDSISDVKPKEITIV